ncbi:SPOR domain-containing protein [Halomonas cupida]|uniref:SPOR domain-containing protein n=1 Tax=Halomonas cupida TaxID=44933 RepID=UPI003A8EDC70
MMVSARSIWRSSAVSIVLLLVSSLMVNVAWAGNPKYAGIVVDAETQEILYAENADEPRYPASLTKMMTLYLLFEALEGRSMSLGHPLPVSSHAASMPATKLWLKAGSTIPVDKAIQALVVRSANDVAVVVAEALGGTESGFAEIMTRKAHELGMENTTFRNASGLPDSGQVTTARDMAILAEHLIQDFPQHYHYFGLTEFTWRGTRHTGHNRLLNNYPGADGLKTGFIRASGFNVATSAVRNGRRMVAVVMGGYTASSRDEQMVSVLDRGFLRASLSDGRGFLADTSISGGLLMQPQQGMLSAPAPSPTTQVASAAAVPVSPGAVQPSRVESVIAPAQVASAAPVIQEASTSSVGSSGSSYSGSSSSGSNYSSASARDPLSSLASSPVPVAASAPMVASVSSPAPVQTTSSPAPASTRSPTPATPTPSQSAPTSAGDWGVQVGAFSSEDSARSQASRAADQLAEELGNARVAVARADNADVYRARLVDLQESQARTACQHLAQRGIDCMVVPTM